jgi:hypothetical protein
MVVARGEEIRGRGWLGGGDLGFPLLAAGRGTERMAGRGTGRRRSERWKWDPMKVSLIIHLLFSSLKLRLNFKLEITK